jgi:hypothetical protein
MLEVNYNYTVLINIPQDLRTSETYDWLRLQTTPLSTLNSNLDIEYAVAINEAVHTMQVISLEDFLNGVLNTVVPIKITDGIFLNETFLYNRNESNRIKKHFFNRDEVARIDKEIYIYNREEYDIQAVDYYVELDYADEGLEQQLKYYLDRFKPAGKKYEIIKK